MLFKRKFDSYYQIDRVNETVKFIPTEEGDLDDYVFMLTQQVLDNKKSRHFKFKSEHKEVRMLICEMLEDKDNRDLFNKNTFRIADKLLDAEILTERRYGHITELKKGSLIISQIYDENYHYFLFSKVEHEQFLNVEELVKQIGIPYEKGTLKTCLIKIDNNNEIIDIIVTDTNKKFASYWVDGLFELEELKSDEKNTVVSFNAMDQLLNRNVKSISPNDYTMIRNHLITYYRTQSQFDFDEMINNVLGDYIPESDGLDMDLLKEKAKALPVDKDFDRIFNIKEDEIRARIRKVIKLNEVMELRLNGSSEELKKLIRSEVINGEKTIIIKTDNEDAFNLFNFNE